MTEEKISELYTRLAFQYESSIDSLLAKQIIDSDIATTSREKFYDSLNEEKLRTSSKINCTQDYGQEEDWRPQLMDRVKSRDVP